MLLMFDCCFNMSRVKRKLHLSRLDIRLYLQAQISHLPFKWQVRDENLACGLCYTSGTTGNPKVICCLRRTQYVKVMQE